MSCLPPRPQPPKVNPTYDPVGRREWALLRMRCQACLKGWREAGADIMGLTVHHIIKPYRSDEPCNYLLLCHLCHDLAEGRRYRVDGKLLPKLSIGICLTIKKEADPEEWNAKRLEELYGQTLPDMEPLPDFLVKARRS